MTDGATSMSMSYTNYKTIERLGEGMTTKVLALVPCSIKNVLLSTLNKALLGGRPRIVRYVLMIISL